MNLLNDSALSGELHCTNANATFYIALSSFATNRLLDAFLKPHMSLPNNYVAVLRKSCTRFSGQALHHTDIKMFAATLMQLQYILLYLRVHPPLALRSADFVLGWEYIAYRVPNVPKDFEISVGEVLGRSVIGKQMQMLTFAIDSMSMHLIRFARRDVALRDATLDITTAQFRDLDM